MSKIDRVLLLKAVQHSIRQSGYISGYFNMTPRFVANIADYMDNPPRSYPWVGQAVNDRAPDFYVVFVSPENGRVLYNGNKECLNKVGSEISGLNVENYYKEVSWYDVPKCQLWLRSGQQEV